MGKFVSCFEMMVVSLSKMGIFLASVLAGFTLGAGYPAKVPFYSRSWPMPTKLTHYVTLDPKGKKAWRSDGPTKGVHNPIIILTIPQHDLGNCIWEMHGVWGWDVSKKQGVVLRENYFKYHPQTGAKVKLSLIFPTQ